MEIIDEETGFNDKTYEMQIKKVRHLRKPEKPDIFLTDEQFKQREEEKRTGLKSLTKEEADTMVCDGAKLSCSHSYVEGTEHSPKGFSFEKVSAKSMLKDKLLITLTVPDYMAGTFLMRKDAVATNYCVHSDNFEIDPGLMCKKGGKCIIKQMANEWTNVSPVLLDGFNALTKDSVLTCKNCTEARITIEDNGQDPELKDAGMEKWLVEHGITPGFREGVSQFFSSTEMIIGGGEISAGLVLIFTPGGTLAGIGLVATGVYTFTEGIRDARKLGTGKDLYVEGLTSIAGIRQEKAEELVGIYDNIQFMISMYNIGKGITKIKKPFSFKNIKEVSEYNRNEEAKAMFFEADRIAALEENSKKLNAKNAQLKNAKKTFELNFGNEDVSRLSAQKRKSFFKQENAINSLEQSKAALIKNREYLKNNTYIPNYQSPRFYSIEDWKNIKDVSKDSASEIFDAIQNSKSVSELQVNYAKGRYGSRMRILPRNK